MAAGPIADLACCHGVIVKTEASLSGASVVYVII
jgi:hypothetical protein